MVICKRNKIIYLGVPHTGSTFIHYHLRNAHLLHYSGPDKHSTLSRAVEEVLDLDGYKVLLYVRNPIDYIASEYMLFQRLTNNDVDKLESSHWKDKCVKFLKDKPTFDDWVGTLKGGSLFNYFVDTSVDNNNVYWLKYEEFGRNTSFLFTLFRVNCPNLSKRINARRSGQTIDMEENTRRKIYNLFIQDFKKFNYDSI